MVDETPKIVYFIQGMGIFKMAREEKEALYKGAEFLPKSGWAFKALIWLLASARTIFIIYVASFIVFLLTVPRI